MSETQRILIDPNVSLDDLKADISKGGKFVVFQYCISLIFAVTLRRLSPAIYIPTGQMTSPVKRKYNLISAIFGWWGIPWGPIYTVKSFNVNNSGGIDVTEDILLNLKEGDISRGFLEMEKISNAFTAPNKWDIKALHKSIKADYEFVADVTRVYAGLFINAEEPFLVIAIESKQDLEYYKTDIQKSLKKEFKSHVFIDIVALNKFEHAEDLIKNGIQIK